MVLPIQKSYNKSQPLFCTFLYFILFVDLLQGKLSTAEPLFEKALVIYEETLDPCHPRVSETLHNFALLKYEQVHDTPLYLY